ncbi:DUF1541 domain-containing protein [Salinicoccus sp. ID82-1]|jgi:prefoldin subunit 5|uniref:YdhK family protein n=1 Tax=Salinicoccus sp. ID82-1 TaxID=2820269 RepID=UPI0009FBED9C|nr:MULTISPECIES: YdhK family protein [Staphylococcaceae]MCG1009692.1 DUF1541 domain-containing protein [Salinicoccus sp. ID82-1]
MNNRFTKIVVTLATVTGISFSAGQVSADSINAAPQANGQAQGEAKVEKRLDKVEKKTDAIQSELEAIEGSIEGPPITVDEVQLYKEYLDKLESLLNRLNAADNHLDAVTKKMENQDASIEETEAEINDIRTSILEVKETIQSIFAEQMSSTGVVPDGLEEAEDPTYEVGSQAIIKADHMPGMYGAEATIAGAFDTVAYSVTYYPTTGGDPVENHKWVIHEELEGPGEAPLEPGTEVTLDADHMKGMDGATAVIESAEDTTVYMLDFTTTTGEKVENHKWVTESELSPVE